MKRFLPILLICLLFPTHVWAKKYQVRELTVKEASEYPAHQVFQNMIIAAHVYNTQEAVQQIFDTKALFERGIMPVLVVVENNNDFAIRVHSDDIYLTEASGVQNSSMKLTDVLLAVSINQPLSSISARKEVLLSRVNPNLGADFEHKFFGEKLIAPGSSDHGIVFFPLLQGEALSGALLYLPEIYNITEGQPLVFFEFELYAQP